MIRLMLGQVGSGKTACMVKEMYLNRDGKHTFSNILTNDIPKNILLNSKMIFEKNLVKVKKSGEAVFDYKLNVDFWKKVKKDYDGVNVVFDEAHTIVSARDSQSKKNKIMGDFLALVRRIVGSDSKIEGDLVFITQLWRRLDIWAREMATDIHYHMCYYDKRCPKCGNVWEEHNEIPNKQKYCMNCKNNQGIVKENFIIYIWKFSKIEKFIGWKEYGMKSYYSREVVTDIENYFSLYDTLQWDNLISE